MSKSSQPAPRSRRAASRGRAAPTPTRNVWPWVIGGGLLVAAIVGVLALSGVFSSGDGTPTGDITGVESYSNLARDHSPAPQTYAQTPPVGGVHSPVWQNCAVYTQPIGNEHGVHSLEHGAVWITYQPDLAADQQQLIRNAVKSRAYTLVSPYPGLPSPVVASAWGLQLKLDNASDPRLAQFITKYSQGPQTPEPGAACSGGTSAPAGQG